MSQMTNTNQSEVGHENDSHTINCPHCKRIIEMIGNQVKQPEVECSRCGKRESKGYGVDTAVPPHFLNENADPTSLLFERVHLCDGCLGAFRVYITNQRRHVEWTRPLRDDEKYQNEGN